MSTAKVVTAFELVVDAAVVVWGAVSSSGYVGCTAVEPALDVVEEYGVVA